MSLLSDPVAILAVLFLNIVLVEWLVGRTFLRHFGTALLVIALTALEANLRIIPANPQQAPVYSGIFAHVAPLAIFLPLLQVNLRSVIRAGGPMIAAFGVGAAATVAGVWLGMMLIDGPNALGEDYRALGGMFTGTYIGGGVNFNALAYHYGIAEQGVFFAGATAVDNILTALWMIVTIGLPRVLTQWFPRNGKAIGEDNALAKAADEKADPLSVADLSLLLALGTFSAWLSELLAGSLSEAGLPVPSVIILTTIALGLAQIPAVNRLRGSRMLGMFAVYLFLAVIGAFCDLAALQDIGQLGVTLLLFGLTIVFVHGFILFGFGALLRLDWDVVAIASQANIGGATSALALARSRGRFDLVLPAVLIGSLGYGLGTYIGFLVAERLL